MSGGLVKIDAIAQLVPQGARVLDLGCGSGELLAHLQQHRGCTGYGVELDDAGVLACVQRGVDVIQLNLDQGLALFADASFDVVLQIDTLQHLRNAQTMLLETVRVGKQGIIAFPNFAYWRNRISILRGRMPVSKTLPYEWYNTPNVRVLTLNDFEILARDLNCRVTRRVVLHDQQEVRFLPNLRGSLAIFEME